MTLRKTLLRGLLPASGVLLVVAVAGLLVGAGDIGPARAAEVVLGGGDADARFTVLELRLPRTVVAIAVGVALGVAGAVLQATARNPLAEPGLLGVSAGASFAVVLAIVLGASAATVAPYVAVLGAAAGCLLALGAARLRGAGDDPVRLVLAGAAFSGLMGAATAAVLTLALSGGAGQRGYRFLVVGLGVGAVFGAVTNLILSRARIDAANAAFAWTVGTLNSRSQTAVTVLEVGLLVCLPLAVVLGRRLNVLRFSDGVATALGVRVRPLRVAVLLTSVVCAGLAVAVAGPLGMIALAAPEAARRLTGPGPVPVLTSALAGALFTLLADLIGRTVMAPLEIPVGLVTAVVGGPYLLWLLLTTRTRRTP